jgi:Flp pilus assembly pilin Flp
VRDLWRDEGGLTTVEYSLLLALIVVAGITAWQGLDFSVKGAATTVSDSLATSGE